MTHPDIDPRSIDELNAAIAASFRAVRQAADVPEEQFHARPAPGKWSIGENLEHLVLSTMGIASALARPKSFFERFGKPEQPVRDYPALHAGYFHRVAGRQAPSNVSPDPDNRKSREELLQSWDTIADKFSERLPAHWTGEELDSYALPHPAFGKLAVRESLFFVIFHNYHHLQAMQKIQADTP